MSDENPCPLPPLPSPLSPPEKSKRDENEHSQDLLAYRRFYLEEICESQSHRHAYAHEACMACSCTAPPAGAGFNYLFYLFDGQMKSPNSISVSLSLSAVLN